MLAAPLPDIALNSALGHRTQYLPHRCQEWDYFPPIEHSDQPYFTIEPWRTLHRHVHATTTGAVILATG